MHYHEMINVAVICVGFYILFESRSHDRLKWSTPTTSMSLGKKFHAVTQENPDRNLGETVLEYPRASRSQHHQELQ